MVEHIKDTLAPGRPRLERVEDQALSKSIRPHLKNNYKKRLRGVSLLIPCHKQADSLEFKFKKKKSTHKV
jgi:hypothetical protein